MKVVVRKKKLLLSQKHRKERTDFAIKDWTLEDWKRVVWSDDRGLENGRRGAE